MFSPTKNTSQIGLEPTDRLHLTLVTCLKVLSPNAAHAEVLGLGFEHLDSWEILISVHNKDQHVKISHISIHLQQTTRT